MLEAIETEQRYGLFVRRPRWGLSWRGWLVGAASVGLVVWQLVLWSYPFLAVTQRVDGELLVVEGWVHDEAIHAAVGEFRAGKYARVVTTGGPVEGLGRYVNDYSTNAAIAAARLKTAGIDPGLVAAAPARLVERDRTYAAACAFASWLHANAPGVRRINVLTADAHARRTRLLFQLALGPDVAVGVIATPTADYDPRHWWRYSEGVKTVLGEAVGYLYAKFIFTPPTRAAASSIH